jgi:nucleotide-binding universal stress UspA family protein
MRTTVVGIDGSEASQAALEWAAAEAARTGDVVIAFHAYDPPKEGEPFGSAAATVAAPAGSGGDAVKAGEAARSRAEDRERAARKRAEDLVAAAVAKVMEQPDAPSFRSETVADPRPARALIRRSEDAGLLVVGSRGKGGFKGLLLGSVGQQCAQYAHCPVTIVRAD